MLCYDIMPARSPDLLVPLLASSSPVTLDQLQAALGQASPRTTFRYLRQVRYLRSYNHNGRFYTDRDPTRFDRFGLLSIGDVHFSRDGPLTTTVERLLAASEDGCTDKELRGILHVPVRSFLLAAVRQGHARREHLGGVYLYFCPGPNGDRQLQARQARLHASRSSELAALLRPELIIEVLLVLVRHPGSRPTQLARHLQGHSPPIRLAQVQAVLCNASTSASSRMSARRYFLRNGRAAPMCRCLISPSLR